MTLQALKSKLDRLKQPMNADAIREKNFTMVADSVDLSKYSGGASA